MCTSLINRRAWKAVFAAVRGVRAYEMATAVARVIEMKKSPNGKLLGVPAAEGFTVKARMKNAKVGR